MTLDIARTQSNINKQTHVARAVGFFTQGYRFQPKLCYLAQDSMSDLVYDEFKHKTL